MDHLNIYLNLQLGFRQHSQHQIIRVSQEAYYFQEPSSRLPTNLPTFLMYQDF